MKFRLKEGILLGTATSATQIEGGDTNNNWYRFSEAGGIKDGSSCVRACDHFTRWREDVDLMAQMGMQIYRLGIEWSRIEPLQGVFSEEALGTYREMLEYMISKGIKPLLTLHHFTNPLWFEDMGGFTHPKSPDIFMNYVKRVVEAYADIVSDYITINEPNIYCTNSLFYGIWPAKEKSLGALIKGYSNMTACHVRAYNFIHEYRASKGYTDTLVSFANHLRIFEAKSKWNPIHRLCARLTSYLFQGALTRSMMRGKCFFPVKRRKGVKRGRYYDFIGVNYYSRSTVKGIADGVRDNCAKNDLDWEIYHEGLIKLSNKLYKKYKAPVFVTENGTCDNTDAFRPLFVYDQLKLISEVENPIERYYHWSFLDNFEWLEGESARFGLVHVNYETEERTVKRSGMLYSDIIKNGGATDEAYDKYVKGLTYNVR